MQENENPAAVIKEWINDTNQHKSDDKGMYSIASLKIPYSQIAVMLCHIFRSVNTSNFKENRAPLIEEASYGYILNWTTIISDNLIRFITIYRENRNFKANIAPPFHMRSYIMDAVCFSYEFPSFGWKWTEEVVTPIFVQLYFLWESK